MAKQMIKFQAHLFWKPDYDKKHEGVFYVFISDMTEYGYVKVGEPQTLEITVPKDFDPIKGQLDALAVVEKKVRADFAARITQLQRERSQLLAIEMTVDA